MASYDFNAQRLFLEADLHTGALVDLARPQAHYLAHVLRLGENGVVHVFNGRDGEWRAEMRAAGGKRWRLEIGTRLRSQPASADLHYVFVPLKQARLDYMVQKAVELGVGRLRPVLSRHGQVRKLNMDRLRANVIEAAEQCGVLSVPTIDPLRQLDDVLGEWATHDATRRLVFCDEATDRTDPVAALTAMGPGPLAVLIGPEGGFSLEERDTLRALPFSTVIPLGPRILRADTAAVAALTLVQATLGDWRSDAPIASDEAAAR